MPMYEDDYINNYDDEPTSLDFSTNDTAGLFRWVKLSNDSSEASNFHLAITSLSLESNINANSNSFGIDNQLINSAKQLEGVRIDLVTELMGDFGDFNSMSYDTHYSANTFKFSFVKTQSSKVAGDVHVRVFLADDDNNFIGDSGDIQQQLTLDSIKIYDENHVEVTDNFTLSVDQYGGVLIKEVAIQNYKIEIQGNETLEYNRIEIISPEENALSNAGFTVGEFTLTRTDVNEPPPPQVDLPILTGLSLAGIVEEEQAEVQGNGNEDIDPMGLDLDSQIYFNETTHIFQESLAPLVDFQGETGTFLLSTDTSNLPILTAGGKTILYQVENNNTLTGFIDENMTGTIEVDDPIAFSFNLMSNGDSTFTLFTPLDHEALPQSSENTIELDLSSIILAENSAGQISLGLQQNLFSIDVIDDKPLANDLQNSTSVPNAPTGNFNVMLVLDFSANRTTSAGENINQWDLIRESAKEYIEQVNAFPDDNVKINIVLVNEGITTTNAYVTPNDALDFLNNATLNPSNLLDYDLGYTTAMAQFNSPGKIVDPDAINQITYILANEPQSPVGSIGIDSGEQQTYQNFLTAGSITSEVIIVDTSLTVSAEALAYDGVTQAQLNPIETTFPALETTLVNTIPIAEAEIITGNLLSNSNAGADGGYLSLVVADGFTYNFTIDENGPNSISTLAPASTFSFDENTDILKITTQSGSEFTVDFSNANYTFKAPSNLIEENTVEQFGFGLLDHDGDLETAQLNINLSNDASLPPIARDNLILTNSEEISFDILKTGLLFNDTGDQLVITNISNVNSGNINDNGDSLTFTDDLFFRDGNSFDYTAQDNNMQQDVAEVIIDRSQIDSPILEGSDLSEYLSGSPNDDIINGYDGNDFIDGGAGTDQLNSGNGFDEFYFELGDGGANLATADILDYSAGNDKILFGGGLTETDIQSSSDGGTGTVISSTSGEFFAHIPDVSPTDVDVFFI